MGIYTIATAGQNIFSERKLRRGKKRRKEQQIGRGKGEKGEGKRKEVPTH